MAVSNISAAGQKYNEAASEEQRHNGVDLQGRSSRGTLAQYITAFRLAGVTLHQLLEAVSNIAAAGHASLGTLHQLLVAVLNIAAAGQCNEAASNIATAGVMLHQLLVTVSNIAATGHQCNEANGSTRTASLG